LLADLAHYPPREPAVGRNGSSRRGVYYAALLLSVGQAAKAETILSNLTGAADVSPRLNWLSTALRQLIAAVRRDPNPRKSR